MKPDVPPSADYAAFVRELKLRIIAARLQASRAVNRELILLYWDIGRGIVEKQQALGWGESVVEMVAADLRRAFPGMTGFSPRNVWYMRRFFEVYGTNDFLQQLAAESPTNPAGLSQPATKQRAGGNLSSPLILPPLVAEIPWGHQLLLLDKIVDSAARIYYLRATARFGWSRNVLLNQIKGRAFERSLKEGETHNFPAVLPDNLAEQADEMLKSSYNLGFLGIGQAVKERDLEDRLVDHLRDFILELGYGFCFVGRQYRLALGSKEYFVDLLFYHRFLKALVAIDLKMGSFEPEFAGKMDFYLNLLNDRERAPDDRPSIGIVLCAEKDDVEVEYALKSKTNPIGVAEYQLQPKLPAKFKGKLPSARQLTDAVRRLQP